MHRANNFDMLRLILAVVVVFVHCSELSLQPALAFIPHFLNSRIAVEGFFVMSGFLILGSYSRSQSNYRQHISVNGKASVPDPLLAYFERRGRRILPAYWVALIFVLILGSLETVLSEGAFWNSSDLWKFIASNLTFMNYLHPAMPGVFAHNPKEPAANGALWTIKLEVMFYLIVPIIVTLCRKLGRIPVLATILVLSLLFQYAAVHAHHPSLAKQLPGQLCFFVLGSAAFFYLDWLREHKALVWAMGVAFFLLTYVGGGIVCEGFGVAALVISFAFFFPHVEGPTKYGDFSYGVYVFHFPIVQTLIAIGFFAIHPYLATLAVLAMVTLLAVLSWNLIEKPALNIKGNKGRDVTNAQRPA
jgi:peptidoglycan/LPS O-acetylase OafA/YrhL